MELHRRGPGADVELSHNSDRGAPPEFNGPSQRCWPTHRIVLRWPAVLDPWMRVGCASAIAEAA
jgi:hypothetical protein